MRIGKLAGGFAVFVTLGAAAAQASPGYTTANVNMRTGPDTEFPSVGVIPEGDPIDVRGCLRDESWCDVTWGDNRGWIYSEYLGFDYRGQTALLPDVGIAAFGIPVVAFAASDYWNRYYVGRPWYADRNRWFGFKVYARPGWRAPPAGPRQAGWWRSGYRAPNGMKPPPGQGWRRGDHWKGGARHDGPGDNGPRKDGPRHDDRRNDDHRNDDRR